MPQRPRDDNDEPRRDPRGPDGPPRRGNARGQSGRDGRPGSRAAQSRRGTPPRRGDWRERPGGDRRPPADDSGRGSGRPGRGRSDQAGRGGRPGGGGARRDGPPTGGRGNDRSRSDGARGYQGRDDRGSGGAPRGDRDQSRSPRVEGPRRPIKGKRRTFDVDSAPNEAEKRRMERGGPEPEASWVDEGPIRREADRAVRRASSDQNRPGRSSQRRAQRAAKRVEGALELDPKKLRARLGQARADRIIQRMGEAAAAFAEERYEDARRTLKPIATAVPDEPAVRELNGLTLYRLGKWKPAIVELEAFVERSQSVEQHPVLADCHRAVGDHARVAELWDELAEASPAATLVAEGRIVRAGSLADQGKLLEAIAVLEAGSLGSRQLKDHHLRMRYVLADLYDRAGDHQSARRYFTSVAEIDPDFFDVRERLSQV